MKRIVRRACRYGREFLGAKPGFFYGLTDTVVELMGAFFPEIKNRIDYVKRKFLFIKRNVKKRNTLIENEKKKKEKENYLFLFPFIFEQNQLRTKKMLSERH